MKIAASREVAAPANRIWAIVTDLGRAAEVLSGVRAIERLDGGTEFGVGTRWRETHVMFRREATEEMVVTALEPGRSYLTEAEGPGVRYLTEVRVDTAGVAGARVSMSFQAEPTGTMGRIMAATMGRLMTRSVRRAIAQDLDDIARAAEAAGS